MQSLKQQLICRKCVICATPSIKWVCKKCQNAHWSFDSTSALSSESTRVVPMVKQMHLHGNLKHVAGLCNIWQACMHRDCLPVDYLIPLPEPLAMTQSRGFQSHLEIAKRLSKQTNIPLFNYLLETYPSPASVMNATRNPFQISLDPTLVKMITNQRIGVVGGYMRSEYLYHYFAQTLKSFGVRWVSNWIMIRIPH